MTEHRGRLTASERREQTQTAREAYVTALGTSKLSPAERGRMGVAAKRKKNPRLFRGVA